MLSNTSKYAVRSMIYLALNSDEKTRIGIKKISEDLKIPSPFLAKILQVLARHKLLISTKGPNGGFILGKDAHQITLYEIVTVIDGSDLFDRCLISLRTCQDENIPCAMHDQYEPIRKNIRKLFTETNLGKLISDVNSRDQFLAL